MYMKVAMILFSVMGVLAVLLAVCLAMLLKDKRQKKPPKPQAPPSRENYKLDQQVIADLKETYELTGSIEVMMRTLTDKYTGDLHVRFQQAVDYLSNSRYRDYETAFGMISDGSAAFAACQEEIIRQELSWRTGLPQKE